MTTAPKWAMYIDGYNFYYAVKNRLPREQLHLGWCDFGKLARQIIGERGRLTRIKYFTAPVGELGKTGGDTGSEQERQAVWLRAVATIPSLEIIKGFYTGDYSDDPALRHRSRSEKETDVNIAISLLLDAAKQEYDRAILVSGDYDQMPTVRAVTNDMGKSVEVWLPPGQEKGRWSAFDGAKQVSVDSITAPMLERARLPERIPHSDGPILAPEIWRAQKP
jgi:uncharacterized LabA/DUF88 family protein